MENELEYEQDYGLAVKNGLIVGAIFGVFAILLYVIQESLLANGMLGIVLILVNLIVLGILGVRYRKAVGGYLSFGDAYKAIFVMVLVCILVSTVFQILLHQVIDPSLGERLTQIGVENAEAMMRRFGAPEDQIQESLQAAREQDNYSIGAQLMGVLYVGVIGNAVITLILAAIAKKKPEEEY
ncbi:DUF4199 domain-containing protein [Roseivirga pacifica]|uniref:DUF4199 domain-containing protein n=1 Tax=Roseivirga pacifica TaxID=1267423 RepID=UPI003BAD557D